MAKFIVFSDIDGRLSEHSSQLRAFAEAAWLAERGDAVTVYRLDPRGDIATGQEGVPFEPPARLTK